MGSRSDWDTMQHSASTLDALGIAHEVQIVSAHRTPDWLFEYAESAVERGLKVIIAGAGGAAHLPGMTADYSNSHDFWSVLRSRVAVFQDGVGLCTPVLIQRCCDIVVVDAENRAGKQCCIYCAGFADRHAADRYARRHLSNGQE